MPSGGAPVVCELRLGGGISGDSSARAAPVPPVSVPKINFSRTTEPSQRAARGAGIPTMTLPPARLVSGAQLGAALAEDDSNQMCRQEIAIPPMQAEGWRAGWSVAMQEDERLRMALFDAESALEQLPPKEAARPMWRLRCSDVEAKDAASSGRQHFGLASSTECDQTTREIILT
jgi:hypothetical protein